MKEEVYIPMKSHVGRSPMYPMRSPPGWNAKKNHVRPLPWERRSLQLFSPHPRLALPVAGNGKNMKKQGFHLI